MDERPPVGRSDRLVILSQLAEPDLSDIHTFTTRKHGIQQARDYVLFLASMMEFTALDPSKGMPIEERPGRFMVLAKWKHARAGHRIVFEVIPEGIYVVRILHTAMNLLDHIGAE